VSGTPAYSEELRQRLFLSARGLTCLFWAALAGAAGFWAQEAAHLRGGASLAVGSLFALPLAAGVAILAEALGKGRRSAGFSAFALGSAALVALAPFWGFWRMFPRVAYFAWNAVGLYAAWVLWLTWACWLVQRYARDLGDAALGFEARVAMGLTASSGLAAAAALSWAMRARGIPWSPANFLRTGMAGAEAWGAFAGLPFLAAAYTLWLGKESGYRRLMSTR